MKQKLFSRWGMLMLCCIMAMTSFAQTVYIEGYSRVGTHEGYPLYAITTGTITVSSSRGSFDRIYVDDERVGYNGSSALFEYTLNISPYCDGEVHKLQLERYSSNYGVCYFYTPNGDLINGIYYLTENDAATVVGAAHGTEEANILDSCKIEAISYPVTSISAGAFKDCSSLTSITLPESLTCIGSNAFESCSSLASISLPEGITSIEEGTFKGCSSLASITLPEGITSIESSAFEGCSSLASIALPEGITSIESSAFKGCSSLTSITLPKGITSIESSVFRGCRSLASITLPKGITSIGDYAFYGCTSLASVVIPNSVTSIGNYAFNNINSITFGTGLLTIGENTGIAKAFWLGNTPPAGYEEVEASVHYVSNDQYTMSNRRQYQFLSSMFTVDGAVYVPISPSDRTCDVVDCVYSGEYAVTIADKVSNRGVEMSVLNINPYAFYDNDHVQEVRLSNNGEIGNRAFSNCDVIDSVHISNNGDIDTLAFYGCDHLQTATIKNNGNVDTLAFYQCNNLQTVNIQNTGDIGSRAFYQCANLQTVNIQNSGDVGSEAFYECTNLQTAIIKNKGHIGPDAFYKCTNLQTATIQNNGNIGSMAFYNCTNLHTANIQNNGEIDDYAFSDCSNLSNAILGDQIIEIGYGAFKDCFALTEFVIPDSVVTLGTSAFENCSSLKSISIGTGVPSLPERVFYGCASLDSLFIPGNVASIGDYAFAGCSSLRDVFIEDVEETEKEETVSQPFPSWMSTNDTDNSTSHKEYVFSVSPGDKLTFKYSVSSEQGYDFLTITLDGAQIVKVSGSEFGSYEKVFENSGQVTLQVSYTKDGSGQDGSDYGFVYNIQLVTTKVGLVLGSNGGSPLFADCPLDEVYIGRKLSYNTGASYGYSPFYQNTSLQTVEITDAETQIYDNEFYGCSNLASLKIGNGVTAIGNWAFSGCSSLDYFSAGYLVETIGTEAFSDCTGLSKFYAYSIVPPVCGDQALDDINKWDCTLYVPDESTDEYQAAPQWKEFFFMEEMEAVLVAEIRLDLTGDTLALNDTVRLTAQILPANATDQTLLWSSSDEGIATVDETGLVTALAAGTATITAKSQDGNAEATCTITVEDNNVTGIDVIFEEDSKIEVFNMYGHKVGNSTEELPTGVYVIKEGNKTYKKVIR